MLISRCSQPDYENWGKEPGKFLGNFDSMEMAEKYARSISGEDTTSEIEKALECGDENTDEVFRTSTPSLHEKDSSILGEAAYQPYPRVTEDEEDQMHDDSSILPQDGDISDAELDESGPPSEVQAVILGSDVCEGRASIVAELPLVTLSESSQLNKAINGISMSLKLIVKKVETLEEKQQHDMSLGSSEAPAHTKNGVSEKGERHVLCHMASKFSKRQDKVHYADVLEILGLPCQTMEKLLDFNKQLIDVEDGGTKYYALRHALMKAVPDLNASGSNSAVLRDVIRAALLAVAPVQLWQFFSVSGAAGTNKPGIKTVLHSLYETVVAVGAAKSKRPRREILATLSACMKAFPSRAPAVKFREIRSLSGREAMPRALRKALERSENTQSTSSAVESASHHSESD